MEVSVTMKAYDVNVNASQESVSSALTAMALGAQVAMAGVTEVKVLSATVAFAMSAGAYTFERVLADAERVDATLEGTTLSVTDRHGNTRSVDTKGEQGEQGKSAYQSWIDTGHTGSEDDFLEWLKGIGEAPDDGRSYTRRSRAWVEETATEPLNNLEIADILV